MVKRILISVLSDACPSSSSVARSTDRSLVQTSAERFQRRPAIEALLMCREPEVRGDHSAAGATCPTSPYRGSLNGRGASTGLPISLGVSPFLRQTASLPSSGWEENVLVIRRTHVRLKLKAEESDRKTATRIHGIFVDKCPVYRSLKAAMAMTTELILETPILFWKSRGCSKVPTASCRRLS